MKIIQCRIVAVEKSPAVQFGPNSTFYILGQYFLKMLLRKFEMPENNVLIRYKTKKKQSTAGRIRTHAILSEPTAR